MDRNRIVGGLALATALPWLVHGTVADAVGPTVAAAVAVAFAAAGLALVHRGLGPS